MKYLIANWKANKNLEEAVQWVDFILNSNTQVSQLKVVICPPFPLIYPLKEKIKNSSLIELGSQDISAFESGNYTGEVTAKSLQGLIRYALVGHSERRSNFKESDQMIQKKIINAKKYGIEPILCIRGEQDVIPDETRMVVYEPVYSIGTGNNEQPAKVIETLEKLKLDSSVTFFYGGSVNINNIGSYLATSRFDGFLVGTASLDPAEFLDLIRKI